MPLVTHLMRRKQLSPEEIAQLKGLIAESEQAMGRTNAKRGERKP